MYYQNRRFSYKNSHAKRSDNSTLQLERRVIQGLTFCRVIQLCIQTYFLQSRLENYGKNVNGVKIMNLCFVDDVVLADSV